MKTVKLNWKEDILGRPFEAVTLGDPELPCTVVRLISEGARRAVLYIHGFSDYFFQAHMAREFTAAAWSFYAVDLRRYGRSLRSGQKMFAVSDLSEYFTDISLALEAMRLDGIEHVSLMGHSTGGLTAALYMAIGNPDRTIESLVLNSPFLDWNLPWWKRRIAVPLLSSLSRMIPHKKVRQTPDASYARSLSHRFGGEWHYDHKWKPDVLPDPDVEWVGAIERGQRALMSHADDIQVPVLLLHSDSTARAGDAPEKFAKADAILDVDLLAARGRRLGRCVTEVTINGGLHDLALSRKDVRERYFKTVIDWIDNPPECPVS